MNQKLKSHEPATGKLLWEGEIADVDAEVGRAASAWAAWAMHPVAYRVEAMRRFGNAVRARKDAFADLIARETGKPLWEARSEVATVMGRVDLAISAYSERTGQRRLEGAMGARHTIRHKPHGVLAVLGPYNFPADAPAGQIIPALIAGNAVLFKPSEKTPASGAMMVELFHEAGIPVDLLRPVIGGAETGEALVRHADVDGVLFTGSARTGIAINRTLATTPQKIVALEMGGNNPIVLWDTGDITAAATIIVQSAFSSAGQRCTAARRLIVRESLAKSVIAEIRKLVGRLIVDHPHAEPAPFMGTLIDAEAADRLTEGFLKLTAMGGRPIVHMKRPHGALPFVTPAVIDMTSVDQRPDVELFGPLLQVIRVEDFDSAIREANATRYGLSASLIGGTPEQFGQFWTSVRAGIINWNGPTFGMGGGAPFGGVGISGNHRPAGWYAADFCAYPVISSEAEQMRAAIGIGLAPAAVRRDD